MKLSKYNIISQLYGSDKYIIVNLLSGNADILDKDEMKVLNDPLQGIGNSDFAAKGYWVNPVEEEKLYKKKYLEFIDNRDTDEIQLFFVPTYNCNFSCSYCFQNTYNTDGSLFTKELIDDFFSFVDRYFHHKQKYITLFGGEPLLNSPKYINLVTYFIDQVSKRKLELAIVTNGFHLAEYIPLFQNVSIREIQVTLDGTAKVHNSRRKHKNGEGTFDKIVVGINMALKNQFPINLRMVVDKNNMGDLVNLAHFADEEGWIGHPLFKTQLGRNYELHDCSIFADALYDRIQLQQDVFNIAKAHEVVGRFHKPSFSVMKFLEENGELPFPLFDSCPATKTEWAFDCYGKIYPCTAMVGKNGESLGTFSPKVSIDEKKIGEWEDRDVLAMQQCRECELQLACGGGCGAVSKNKDGIIASPDCRPIKELVGIGASYYFMENNAINTKQT